MIATKPYLCIVFLVLSGCSILGSREGTPDPPVTPSSTFVWTVDTLGATGTLPTGVEVISENEIWLSGLYYRTPYDDQGNAARWDGEQWEIVDLKTRIDRDIFVASTRLLSMMNSKQILFKDINGSYIIVKDNQVIDNYRVGVGKGSSTGIIKKDSSSFFIYGSNGNLVYGETDTINFLQIDSNTQETITAGHFANDTLKLITDSMQGEYQIINVVDGVANLELEDTFEVEGRIDGPFTDVWHDGNTWYYGTQQGIYTKTPRGFVQFTDRLADYIVGNGPNDILFTFFYGFILHWNGLEFNIVENPVGTDHFGPVIPPDDQKIFVRGVSFKGDIVCIVGQASTSQRAVVWIGKRVNK